MQVHGNTRLAPLEKRVCLELIYAAGETDGCTAREMATRLETKIGGAVQRRYLLELAGKLPEGLTNGEGKLTLRRAVNKQLGLDKPYKHTTQKGQEIHVTVQRRDYTNEELMHAVLKYRKLIATAAC